MKVFMLATCRSMDLLPGMTMVFDTLRVGFPNAEVKVFWNHNQSVTASLEPLKRRCLANQCELVHYQCERFGFVHPHWLEEIVERPLGHERVAIIDTDMVFWDNCESFDFGTEVHLAGVRVPKFQCPYVRAITMPRVHTCFVLIPDHQHLLNALLRYKFGEESAHYTVDYFGQNLYVHDGKRYFQDTMTGLCSVVRCGHFGPKELACFDHLHNGTIIDQVAKGHPDGDVLRKRVEMAYKVPTSIKGSWDMYDRYYAERSVD